MSSIFVIFALYVIALTGVFWGFLFEDWFEKKPKVIRLRYEMVIGEAGV